MARKYENIKQYEREILDLKGEGLTHKEIGEKLGFNYSQIKKFFERYNKRQRMIESGKKINHRGRPCKQQGELPPSIQKLDKIAQMRYVLDSKERYIKRLEMENELMRDFLSLTERK